MSENKVELKITEDKLIDILMHAATREDLAKLDAKVDARFDKIDIKFDKIDDRFEKIDAKFDKINGVFEKIDAKFDAVNGRIDKLYILIIVSILVPIMMHIFLK